MSTDSSSRPIARPAAPSSQPTLPSDTVAAALPIVPALVAAAVAEPDPAAPLILHVTEAMGGGLEDALYDFVRSAPQYRHAVLFTRRGDFATAEAQPAGLVEVVDVGHGVLALLRAYGATVRRLRPDVIHLHSAWAGLVGRAHPRGPARARLVYSPHSYFFDRRDIARPLRVLARAVERLLVARTDLVAAVSPAEADEARRLGAPVVHVPNVVRLPAALRWQGPPAEPEVLLVGRIAAQKDPEFLLRVLQHARLWAPDVRWTWIGAGDEQMERRLRADGVDVTGWVSRTECLDRMTRASAYLHTAWWEGSPITLLEAAAIGVPIVARSISSLDSLGFDPTLRTPQAVADALLALLGGLGAPVAPQPPTPEQQARAIRGAYESLVGAAPSVSLLPA